MRSRVPFIKYLVLFPFLLPVFFIVHGLQVWHQYLDLKDVLPLAGMYLLLSVIVFGIVRAVLWSNAKAGLCSFLLLCLFFFWGYLTDNIKALLPHSALSRLSVQVPVFLLLIIAAVFAFGRMNDNGKRRVVYYLNLLLLIYIGVDCCVIGWHNLTSKSRNRDLYIQNMKQIQAAGRPGWDVYLVIFDEYASANALQRNLGYDNTGIDSFLQAKGFSIQRNSRSNYNLTQFSMASMLNMAYLNGLPPDRNIGLTEYNTCVSLIGSSKVAETFKEAGYQFDNYSIFNVAGSPAFADEFFLPVKTRLLTANTFYERQMSVFPMRLIHGKSRISFLWEYYYFKGYRSNNRILNRLKERAAAASGKAGFIYAHLMVPHPPYYYDSNGKLSDLATVYQATRDLDPRHYEYGVQYANTQIKEIVNKILSSGKNNSVIMLMGDHGYRKVVHDGDSALFFSNFNAVYFPDRDYSTLYDSISNVNTMRVVMNKVLKTGYPLLPDSTVLLIQQAALREEDAHNDLLP